MHISQTRKCPNERTLKNVIEFSRLHLILYSSNIVDSIKMQMFLLLHCQCSDQEEEEEVQEERRKIEANITPYYCIAWNPNG